MRHRRRAAHAHHGRGAPDPETTEEAEYILATLAHPCPDPAACDIEIICQAYANDLTSDLPDIDRATIGRIVIHVAGALGTVIESLRKTLAVDSDPTAVAVNTLAGAGARLYLDGTRPAPPTSTIGD